MLSVIQLCTDIRHSISVDDKIVSFRPTRGNNRNVATPLSGGTAVCACPTLRSTAATASPAVPYRRRDTSSAANADDEHAVAAEDLEVVLLGHAVAKSVEGFTVELDQLVADLAVEMVVPRIAVVVLVDAPAAERHLPQQPCLDQLAQRAIDRRAAA